MTAAPSRLAFLAGLALATSATSSLADDGATEINQATALAGGINGDLVADPADFPVRITQPGSYRLTSSLATADPGVTLIRIEVSGPGSVDLDLNGFSITGPNDCGGVPATCTFPFSAAAHGISAALSFGSHLVIHDGTIRGVAGNGISVNTPSALIRNVYVGDASGSGIRCSSSECRVFHSWIEINALHGLHCDSTDCEVVDTQLRFNSGDGVNASFVARVRGCQASNNGSDGVQVGAGSLVAQSTLRANVGNAISVGADSLVLQNVVQGAVVGGTRIQNVCTPACP